MVKGETSFEEFDKKIKALLEELNFREQAVLITRRTFTAALSLTGLAALPLFAAAPDHGSDGGQRRRRHPTAIAAGHGARPCRRRRDDRRIWCADLPALRPVQQGVFPKLKSEYIDTGKIRYVFRNFPLNIKDLACEMLARNIAKDDGTKYFAVVDIMFQQQNQLVEKTGDTLKLIGRQAGLSVQRSRIA